MRSQHLSLKAYTLLLEKRQVYFLGLYFWVSLIAHLVKNLPAMQETPVQFLGQEDPLEKGQATYSSILGLPFDSAGKESTCNAGDLDLIPGLGRYPGEGKGCPLQYSGLENSTLWSQGTTFHFSIHTQECQNYKPCTPSRKKYIYINST